MLFSSLPFLYCFLPVVVGVYFLVPRKAKNGILLAASLFFYGWGEPRYLALMVFSILLFYACGLAIGAAGNPKVKKAVLIFSLTAGASLLAVFKYADFFLSSITAVTGWNLPLLRLALPIGISFYTFQCMSYTVDIYRGSAEPARNLITFGAYVSLFPQLIAGPIVRYTDVARDLESREQSWVDFRLGLRRFLFGLGKKVLLANSFAELVQAYRASTQPSVLFGWLYAVGFALQIYFDFSGYSDMAIGLGRIFGFRFPENFDYPYLSRSITEFWRRWHMTLGGWFRDYVYIPLGGSRVSRWRWFRNVLVVWMLTGLWHGASWNFVLWGLFFAMMLLIEKAIPALRNLPAGLAQGYTMLVVVLSFVLFNAETLSGAVMDFRVLFGAAGLPLTSAETMYCLRSFSVLLLAGGIGATPLPQKLGKRLANCPLLETAAMAVLLLLCTAFLVDGSFNPFLYFRF